MDGLFGRFPYLLPTLAVLAWGVVAGALGHLWLPADDLTMSQAGSKLCGRKLERKYRALNTANDDGRETAPHETEFASYMRIMRTPDTRVTVMSRVMIPMTVSKALPSPVLSLPPLVS